MSLLSDCKKDIDTPISQITIYKPIANTSFEVFDTLDILLMVESSQSEVGLRVSLLNQDYTPVSNSNTFVMSNFKTGVEASLNFIFDNYYLESDYYYLYIKVSDASGDVKAYRSIFIEGIPREFKGLFVVSKIHANLTRLEKLDTEFTTQGILDLFGNHAGSAVNLRHKLVSVAGKNSGNLLSLDSDSLELQWEVPIIPNPVQPYFTFLKQTEKYLFTGFYNGDVHGYDPSGSVVFSNQANGQTFPSMICLAGNFLVVASTSRSNLQEHWLETYFISSGASNSKIKLQIKPVELKALDDGSVLVFGNDENGNLATRLFNPETGLVYMPYQPFALPEKLLVCAAEINESLTLLGLESGIYLYNYQSDLSLVTNVISPQILRWEDLSKTIWSVDGEEIMVFSSNGENLLQQTYDFPIYNLLLDYNK